MPFGDEPVVPQGFRPVSMTQALLEYAAPLMAYVADGTVQDPNEALQVGLLLWNSTLPEAPVAVRQSRQEIVAHIEATFHMGRQEAEAFCEHMIERKAYLFPDEMQPAGSMTMFMRKEVEYLITPLAESQLHLSDQRVPPDRDDAMWLEALRQLEARIDEGDDYGDWEADFFTMQERCCQRYHHWLLAKGVPETLSQQFAFCLEPYLTFIYQYDAGNVQDVWPEALEEFFMDWLASFISQITALCNAVPPLLWLMCRHNS
jgi:hypothetical protein